MNKLSIYVHFPFCERKCSYCDFISFNCSNDTKTQYVQQLNKEIERKSEQCLGNVHSIYFGGGTPTSLSVELILSVLDTIKRHYNVDNSAEITIEGNPATFDECKLKALSGGGFNRFSAGVQSFNDNELKAVERLHNSHDAVKAVQCIKKYFNNFSLDLMIGLPNQTENSLLYSIEKAVELSPKHISTYMLKVEPGTKLERQVESGEIILCDDDKQADLYDLTVETLKKCGYLQYETSNFCMEGYPSHHNLSYWNLTNYLGFGIASHSLYDGVRYYNTSIMNEYLNDINVGVIDEKLELADKKSEYIMLQFRLNSGINLQEYKVMFNTSFDIEYQKTIEKHKQYLDITETHIAIQQKYFSVASAIIIEFI